MLSEHLFFVIERITDILKLEKEREVEYSDDERKGILAFPSKIKKQRIKKSIEQLHEQLSRVVVYLRGVEKERDEQQHDNARFYLELNAIANSSDHILNRVISDDDVIFNICDCFFGNDITSDIYHLVNRIHNSHHLLNSGPTYNFNTGGNTNLSGQQIIESTIINIDPSHNMPPMIRQAPRPKTYGHVLNLDLVGFNHEIQILLKHLTQDNEFCVVGIVGMGGLGKTTLAKHIYHHPEIKKKFNCRAWVCISQCWDKISILNAIWSQAAEDPKAKTMDYDQAVGRLHQFLSLESYLVILDDIWSIDAWNDISPALPYNTVSKVVVTARNNILTRCVHHTVCIVEPKPLDDKESWDLLIKKKAFPPNKKVSQVLLTLGEEMVKKCKGLPLATVALAGVLGMDKKQISWERISKTLTHNILKANDQSTQGVVKTILALSYYELPHHLKQCVLYLRLFPEDYEINARNLMKMWTTEGLISTQEDQESIAEEYLNEIVERYIVKVAKTNFMGQVVRIRIHDLLRQTFVDIDKERGFLRDSLRLTSSTILYGDEQNCNFSSMSPSERIEDVERVFLLKASSYIRSVIFLNHLDLFGSELQSVFVKFRLLRVLILRDIYIIPEEIGNLIHLRYFELWGDVEQLPGCIGNLKNLRTLDMRYLMFETGADQLNMFNLKELRHLYLPKHFLLLSVDMENLKLERLEKLKTLWNVRGDYMTGLSAALALEELSVNWISSEEELGEVFRTPSITSNNLKTLELDWHCSGYGGPKLCDMSILRECKSLRKLKICGQIQASTDIIFPPNLIKLEMRLTCLENGEVMNIISESCPDLEILKFGVEAFMGEELVCYANSFPKLVKLTLDDLQNLKQWIIESTAMLSLHYLTIRECEHLTVTPEGRTRISQIPQLTIQHCPHLDSEP